MLCMFVFVVYVLCLWLTYRFLLFASGSHPAKHPLSNSLTKVSVCSPPPSSPCFAVPVHPRFASRFPSRFALRSLLRPSLCCSLRSSLLASHSPTEKAPWRLNSTSYRIPGCKRALLSIQIAGRPVAPTSSEATMALPNGKRPCGFPNA